MKYKQNLHTHTTYADGNDSPEELILEAINKGFNSLGFSEHTYSEYSTMPCQMKISDMINYKNEINSLKKKYQGKINVFCGLEYEFYSNVPTDGFDYLIGSVHYLDIDGEILTFDRSLEYTLDFIKEFFKNDGLNFAKKYFETVAMLPQKAKFDIIGHFDIFTKNNEAGKFIDISSKQYLNFGFEAIHNLKGKIPFFEVNTGAISRGYRTTPYPQIEFLKEFKNCGFGAIVTSDCHNKDHLDCGFDEAVELLLKAGFKTQWILTNDGFREILL